MYRNGFIENVISWAFSEARLFCCGSTTRCRTCCENNNTTVIGTTATAIVNVSITMIVNTNYFVVIASISSGK